MQSKFAIIVSGVPYGYSFFSLVFISSWRYLTEIGGFIQDSFTANLLLEEYFSRYIRIKQSVYENYRCRY